MKSVSRFRRALWIAGALLLVYTLVGFFVVPPIAKSQLEKRLSAELGRRVTVEKVRANPFALSVTLENFSIKEADGTASFLGWQRLYVNAEAVASIWGEWVVREVALDGFDARVAINADQSFNFSDILAKLAPPGRAPAPAGKPGRPVRVGSLRVASARVDFSDASRPQPFATVLGPLTFALTEFRTVSDVGAPYRFEALTESGERLTWTGTLQAEPLRSTGELTLENILLPKYAPYYADRFQADIVAGKLNLRGRYEANLTPGQQVMKLMNGAVQLREFKLVERANKETAVELPSLDVTGIQADALTQKASIEAVALNGGQISARRNQDGTINLLTMLKPAAGASSPGAPSPPPPASPTPSSSPAKPPEITVGEVAVKEFQVNVNDLAAPRPAQLALRSVQLSLRNVTLAEGAEMPLQLTFAMGAQGTARIEGKVGIAPLSAELAIDAAAMELAPLSPYLEQFVNARLTQGTVGAKLTVLALMADGDRLAAALKGDITVEKFGLVDAAHNEELAGFDGFTVRGLHASTAAAQGITIEELNVERPFARVIVNTDKTLNLATVARVEKPASANAPPASSPNPPPATEPSSTSKPPAATTAPASSTPPLPRIEVGKVVINAGDFRFTDRSVEPNVRMTVDRFGGMISGLSSVNPGKGSVDLKATVDGAGPVAIAGKLDPLGARKTVDLKIDVKNMDLLPFSPYSGKYAGYELARGKLVLDVKLLVDGNKIDAANVITLNQFTFGSPVKSPDATGLPVRLGVALLKDMDGKIVIDVPVQGSTDDPSFRVGRVVLRVITNLLTKAATSPFSLLGAAFGGGGEELAFQEFAPGSTGIVETEKKKLETMVKALTNRPALSVAVEGSYDPAVDAPTLKRAKLNEVVRRTVWEAKRRSDPNTPPPAQLIVTAEEEAATVAKLYDEKFPPGTEFGAPVPPPPARTTPPEPPSGFFARLIDSLTGQTARKVRAVEEENARRAADHAKAVEAAKASGSRSIEEMTRRLAETMDVGENELRALAQTRAQHVRDYFVETGKIAADRVFLAQPATDAAKERKGPRVFLNLQ